MKKLNKSKYLISLGAGAILLLFATVSFAATPTEVFNEFQPEKTSMSQELLVQLFGPVVEVVRGESPTSQNTGIVFALSTFTGVVLAIASLIIAYITIAGSAATASSGQALGKWSTEWTPIRMALGVSLTIPLPALSGLSVMQGIVVGIGILASGFADFSWQKIAESASSTNIVNQPAASFSGTNGTSTATMLLRYVNCMQTINSERTKAGVTPLLQVNTQTSSSLLAGVTGQQIKRISFGSPELKNECGDITYPIGSEINDSPISQLLNLAVNVKVVNDISKANDTAIQALITDLTVISNKINTASQTDAVIGTDFLNAVTKYNQSLTTAANKAFSEASSEQVTKFRENAKQGGWVLAGSFIHLIGDIQDDINKVLTTSFGLTKSNFSGNGLTLQELQKIKLIVERTNTIIKRSIAASGLNAASQNDTLKENDSSVLKKVIDALFSAFTGIDELYNQPGNSPLTHVKIIGDGLIRGADTIFLLGAAINFAAGTTDFTMQTMSFVNPVISGIVVYMLTMGFALSLYLPTLPFIIWTMGVLRWLILMIEGLIAAPIFAIMLITPGGEGITNGNAPGFKIYLSLFLRPVLMLFGLVASLALFTVGIFLFDETFGKTLMSSVNSSIWSYLFQYTMYTIFMLYIGNYAFRLIDYVPDQVLRFIGAPGESSHSESDKALGVLSSSSTSLPQLNLSKANRGDGDGDQKNLPSDDPGPDQPRKSGSGGNPKLPSGSGGTPQSSSGNGTFIPLNSPAVPKALPSKPKALPPPQEKEVKGERLS